MPFLSAAKNLCLLAGCLLFLTSAGGCGLARVMEEGDGAVRPGGDGAKDAHELRHLRRVVLVPPVKGPQGVEDDKACAGGNLLDSIGPTVIQKIGRVRGEILDDELPGAGCPLLQ